MVIVGVGGGGGERVLGLEAEIDPLFQVEYLRYSWLSKRLVLSLTLL